MKTKLYIMLIMCNIGLVHAQNMSDIDSLKAELISFQKVGVLDSAKIINYHHIFNRYQNKDFSKAEKIGKMIIKTCEEFNDNHLLDNWYGTMGQFYQDNKLFSMALSYYLKGKNTSKILGQESYWWTINIGNIYYAQSIYDKASFYYWEAIHGFEKQLEPNYSYPYKGIAVSYSNLGLIFSENQQYDSALVMFHYSFLYRKKANDPYDLAYISMGIAKIQLKIKDYDSVLIYINKAFAYDERLISNSRKLSPQLYNLKAQMYLDQSMYERALEVLDSAIQLTVEYNNVKIALESYNLIIEIQTRLKMYEKAIKNSKTALSLAKKTENIRISANLLKTLSNLYSITKNYSAAFSCQTEYISLKDSISEQNLSVLLYKFEAEQSEQKVSFLEKELVLSDKEKTMYQYLVLAGVSLTIVLLLFFIVILRSSKILRKKNIKINNQNVEIETQNDELSNKNQLISNSLNELKKAQAQLVQSEKMASLGLLTAGIAHEINNPVNFIYTGVNSLKKDFKDIDIVLKEVEKLTPETKNLKEEIIKIKNLKEKYYFNDAYSALNDTILDIETGSERTSEIIRGLRDFSRADKGEYVLADIHKGIEASLLLLKNKYKNKIEIVKNYDEHLPKIECLPGKINQAFMNILDNAIDAIEVEGKIEISTKHVNSNIVISIKDSGIGLDNETKEKIFDPFFTTKDVGEGTGLGMAITYGIIKEHNGKIDVKTEIGKGTEFIINFPLNK